MNAPKDAVIARSRARYNEGYMPGFGNDFETEALPGALLHKLRKGLVVRLLSF